MVMRHNVLMYSLLPGRPYALSSDTEDAIVALCLKLETDALSGLPSTVWIYDGSIIDPQYIAGSVIKLQLVKETNELWHLYGTLSIFNTPIGNILSEVGVSSVKYKPVALMYPDRSLHTAISHFVIAPGGSPRNEFLSFRLQS